MNFRGTGTAHHRGYRAFVDPGSWHDGDATIRALHQCANRVYAFRCSRVSSGRQYAIEAHRNTAFQGFERVACHVESPVTGHLHGACTCNKFAASIHIEVAIRCKDAEDHTVSTESLGHRDVAFHSMKLVSGIQEVTTARADHNIYIY